jgi:crossover junction endodeoxyribonuclease RuvC
MRRVRAAARPAAARLPAAAVRPAARAVSVRGADPAGVRVLGIDPGSQRTGFGVLDAVGPRLTYVASGVIRTQKGEFADRLCEIFRCVQTIVAQYRPHEIAIERVFVNRNPDSALKLGQARGAAICGTVDANAEVFEYATRQIKQAVVGSGSAEKAQVQLMMKSILKLDGPLSPDAADALAAAVCHALRGSMRVSVQRSASRR